MQNQADSKKDNFLRWIMRSRVQSRADRRLQLIIERIEWVVTNVNA